MGKYTPGAVNRTYWCLAEKAGDKCIRISLEVVEVLENESGNPTDGEGIQRGFLSDDIYKNLFDVRDKSLDRGENGASFVLGEGSAGLGHCELPG